MTGIRLGVLGAGIMGERLARAAVGTGRFTVTAVADTDLDRARELAGRYAASAHAGIEELFTAADIDAVYIALPHHLHRPACLAAAAAGVHVLVDKPLCATVEDADQILAAAKDSPAVWMVGFSYRFRSEWRRTHSLVSSGAIGTPYFVSDVVVEAYASTPAWYWEAASGGGVLQLQSHHTFDRQRWLLGRPAVQVACTVVPLPGGTERSVQISADYGDGAISGTSLSFGLGYDAHQPRTLFVIQGETGMIQLDDTRTLRLITGDGIRTEEHDRDDWLGREITEFAEAVDGSLTRYPSLDDGVAALRGVVAAARAARTGMWVRLDD